MQLEFNLSCGNITLNLPTDYKFRNQLLIQNGHFGKGLGISDHDLTVAIVKNYTPILERSLKYLEVNKVLKVLDIGAGNSIIDIVLAKIYPNSSFILLDGDEWNNNPNLHSTEFKPYNHWQHVVNLIAVNELDSTRFKFVGLDYAFNDTVDYVVSYGSCGLHYPIQTYIDKIDTAISTSGYIAIGPILNINSQVELLNNKFKLIELIELNGFIDREANQMSSWSKYFDREFTGPYAHAGVWKKK